MYSSLHFDCMHCHLTRAILVADAKIHLIPSCLSNHCRPISCTRSPTFWTYSLYIPLSFSTTYDTAVLGSEYTATNHEPHETFVASFASYSEPSIDFRRSNLLLPSPSNDTFLACQCECIGSVGRQAGEGGSRRGGRCLYRRWTQRKRFVIKSESRASALTTCRDVWIQDL